VTGAIKVGGFIFVMKSLPYFKFIPASWDNGNIQMCSRESKGLFIDLCAMYWSRLGELPYALALQKLCNGNANALQELFNNEIIVLNDDQIIIEFLDEQLNEFKKTSKKRSQAANKRWGSNDADANALQMQSKSNAIKIREEKIREDNKDVNNQSEIIALYDRFLKEIENGSHQIVLERIKMQLKLESLKSLSNQFNTHLLAENILHPSTQKFLAHFKNWLNSMDAKGRLEEYKTIRKGSL
jgi:hypothetical protein